ncbi:hypothetical protein C8R45DRAFT_187361 [Mycena sanguinolenta]|nr:hypothetical protein C8R45DRAFT_187361 [Mycena sanguinolenta]
MVCSAARKDCRGACFAEGGASAPKQQQIQSARDETLGTCWTGTPSHTGREEPPPTQFHRTGTIPRGHSPRQAGRTTRTRAEKAPVCQSANDPCDKEDGRDKEGCGRRAGARSLSALPTALPMGSVPERQVGTQGKGNVPFAATGVASSFLSLGAVAADVALGKKKSQHQVNAETREKRNETKREKTTDNRENAQPTRSRVRWQRSPTRLGLRTPRALSKMHRERRHEEAGRRCARGRGRPWTTDAATSTPIPTKCRRGHRQHKYPNIQLVSLSSCAHHRTGSRWSDTEGASIPEHTM